MNAKLALAAAMSALCLPVGAATSWTDWTSATAGAPGSASGTLGSTTVTYSGEVLGNRVINGGFAPFWAPDTSFIGGTVTTSPATVGDIITLGGASGTNTLTFSTPVVDPVIAIWSLGQAGGPASFTFDATPTFEVGGTNVSFGGQAITVSGNTVSGLEGNGVVQFTGTFSSISWTDTPEFYYGFTVGSADAIPEPSTWVLLALGLAGIGIVGLRRR